VVRVAVGVVFAVTEGTAVGSTIPREEATPHDAATTPSAHGIRAVCTRIITPQTLTCDS
jgi:hypothetical protein